MRSLTFALFALLLTLPVPAVTNPPPYEIPAGFVTFEIVDGSRVACYVDTNGDGSIDTVDFVDVDPATLTLTLVTSAETKEAAETEHRWFETTYRDAAGMLHTIRTPRASDSPAARRRALEDHADAVRLYQVAFPPAPVVTTP